MSSLKYWIWLTSKQGLGNIRTIKLIDCLGSPENIYFAGRDDYLDIEGINHADINQLMNKELDSSNKVLAACSEIGCRIITLNDSEYPERLRNIYDPPLLLYIHGSLPVIDDEPVVGVVGTRKCTPYGINAAKNTGYKLSKSGIIVVTGLAEGIDTAASAGALTGGSKTVGVIGSGLDVIFPYKNKQLFKDVARAGAVISEYPPGTPGFKYNFPARNRIISGISLGVAVIEAPQRSGALITAARALEQGRDIFALPGNVDAESNKGSNALLREGAIPFTSADDIIEEYRELFPDKIKIISDEIPVIDLYQNDAGNNEKQKKSIDNTSKVDYIDLGILLDSLDGDEKEIVRSIGGKTADVNEIIHTTGFPAQKVFASLTMLEINGYIKCNNNGKWETIA